MTHGLPIWTIGSPEWIGLVLLGGICTGLLASELLVLSCTTSILIFCDTFLFFFLSFYECTYNIRTIVGRTLYLNPIIFFKCLYEQTLIISMKMARWDCSFCPYKCRVNSLRICYCRFLWHVCGFKVGYKLNYNLRLLDQLNIFLAASKVILVYT